MIYNKTKHINTTYLHTKSKKAIVIGTIMSVTSYYIVYMSSVEIMLIRVNYLDIRIHREILL